MVQGPSKKWEQFMDDAICVEDEIQQDGLVELPTITNTEDEPQLDNDK
jgi:hypothetical protein